MLEINDNWKEAAAAGTVSPRLMLELKPTVLYKEVCQGGGWKDAVSSSSMNLGHDSGDLLLENEDVQHEESQTVSRRLGSTDLYDYNLFRGESGEGWDSYDRIGQWIQTFKVDKAFKLRKLYIGVRNDHRDKNGKYDKFKEQLIIRLFSNLEERLTERLIYPTGAYQSKNAKWAIRDLYGDRVETLLSYEVDFSDGSMRGASNVEIGDNIFIEIDCSEENIWVPGGGNVCAIDLSVSTEGRGSEMLLLYGAAGGSAYTRGQLYEHNHQTGDSYNRLADLGFVLYAEGYKTSGEAVYQFDLGEDPEDSLTGELEIRYCEPGNSSVDFQVREKPDGGSWGSWRGADDGTALTGKRWIQVKVLMSASDDQLLSPRVYSIRAAYKRSDSFVWGPGKIDGKPNLVSSAPTYSAEGDPLTGALQFSDTGKIELLDPSAMISKNIFGQYNLKNDQIVIKIGFDGLAASDFLTIKTVWIESWEPGEGSVIIKYYDRQRNYRSKEIPSPAESPEAVEQIHFNSALPGAIKKELLLRAGERPSSIDEDSFDSLDSELPWELTHVIKKPLKVQKLCKDLNRHLLSFEYIDESGKWKTPCVNFGSSPAATIQASEVILQSESYDPGWEMIRNSIAVFFGGEGNEEKNYREIVIYPNTDSAGKYKEISTDKLLSEWIPGDDDPGDTESGIAIEIANRRNLILRDGFRQVAFSTRLDHMDIQIGDHIYFYSSKYQRAGCENPNPLLIFITRKHINVDLRTIDWRGLVLLDSEQSAPGVSAVNPPQNFDVTDNGNRSATWTWDKSSDDNGVKIIWYYLYRRKKGYNNWGAPVARVEATGSASYEYTDTYKNCLTYDFGIRAVYKDRRVSKIVVKENITITDDLPSPPTWELRPVVQGFEIYITEDVAEAIKYRVYKFDGDKQAYIPAGEITAPAIRKRKAGYGGHYNYRIEKAYGIEYGRFKLSTISAVGEGSLSDEQAAWSLPYQGTKLASDIIKPGLPSESGTYPLLRRWQNVSGEYRYTVVLKITAPAGYEDLVARYEIQRRDDSGGSYGEWETVGTKIIDKHPAPHVVPWINQDVQLTPGINYQWQVRAWIAKDTPSDWSDSLTKQVTKDSTPPDKPTLSVTQHPLGLLLKISKPAEDGEECKDFSYFKIEGNKGAGWVELEPHHDTTFYLHNLANSAMSETWQYRVTAYDRDGNASEVSDATTGKSPELLGSSCFQADCIQTSHVDFVVVGTDNIVGTINASSEGIAITGRTIVSAGTGARVEFFPSANIGFRALDNLSNEIFKIIVGGTDVGDVIIGNTSGSYMKWDKSENALSIIGDMIESYPPGDQGDQNRIKIYNDSDTPKIEAWGGNEIRARLSASAIGTDQGTGTLYLEHDTVAGSGYISTMTLDGKSLTCTYAGNNSLVFKNDSTARKLDLVAADLDVGRGINITGEWGGYGGGGCLLINGTIVIESDRDFINIKDLSLSGVVKIDGNQVVGARQDTVGDASTASGISEITLDSGSDSVNRAGFNTKLANMRTEINSIKDSLNALVGKFNLLLDRIGTSGHGLTAD